MTAARKLKKCKVCPEQFEPMNSLQKACSPRCALSLVKQDREKQERKELLERKRKLKSRSDWMKDAQQAFNAYIRERDKDLPCISCGTFNPNIEYCAGHYLTRGANPELSFEPLNVHKQCNHNCNLKLSGNIVNYRIGLLMRLGEEVVAFLEGPHEPKKYTIEDLKAIKSEYQRKRKELITKPFYPV